MNGTALVAGVAAIVLLTAAPPAGFPRKEKQQKAQEEIMHLERELAGAALRRDAAFYDRVIAEDFIGINHLGQEMTKSQILTRLDVKDYQVETLRHENIRVRTYGDCAIATARTVLQARYNGQQVSGEFPYLRVWIRRGGRWQAVATQSTMIPQP